MAILHALGVALALARRALLAAHPQLEAMALPCDLNLTGAAWIADGILAHVSGLEVSIQRYQREIQRARRQELYEELHEDQHKLPF